MPIRVIHDIEAFFREEAAAQAMAGAAIKPAQREIKVGDFFLRPGPEGIAIFSEVIPSLEEDEDEDGNEIEREVEQTGDYRFTKSYSAWCPEGEMGDVHLSEVTRTISKDQFEKMRDGGWPLFAHALKFLGSN